MGSIYSGDEIPSVTQKKKNKENLLSGKKTELPFQKGQSSYFNC